MQKSRELIVEPIGLQVDALPHPLDFTVLFGNSNPVEIEIGMGKGTFLASQAKLHPQFNYIGIEYANWFWRYASDRLRRNHCDNVRTARAEAVYFFREFVPDQSLQAIHIYFPDPWPKKRHHKRRLIQPPFLLEINRVLKSIGVVRLVTDHAEYFTQMQEVIAGSPLKQIEFDRPQSNDSEEFVGTNFERKYRREGRPFYATAAMKRV